MFQPFEITENRKNNDKLFIENLNWLLPQNKCSNTIEEMSVLSNTASFLNWYLNDVNWVGFYILSNDELHVGPFQGLPGCSPIKIGKGVCGTAIKTMKPLIVPDVNKFPGHIACDDASQSEIVIPFYKELTPYGLLDIDSPVKNRFNEEDLQFLNNVCRLISKKL